jgi:hypothetical protein
MAAQKATELRRLMVEVEANAAALRARHESLEAQLVAVPARNWPEAAVKARYLLKLLSDSPAGRDHRLQKLIDAVLKDFEDLSAADPDDAGT